MNIPLAQALAEGKYVKKSQALNQKEFQPKDRTDEEQQIKLEDAMFHQDIQTELAVYSKTQMMSN
jgi:hypothetical protein